MWFDDTANANTTSGFRCLYCVLIFPTDAKRKKHVREKHAALGEPRPCAYCDHNFPTNSERKKHVQEAHEKEESKPRPETSLVKDSPVRLSWGWQKIKADGCYTEAIPRTWVPLTTGLVEPVVPSSFSITTYAPTPQPPPQPVPNSELYQTFQIPVIPKRSFATTERGINAFRERRDSLLVQRKMLHAAGEQLLKDNINEGKELAKKQGVPYTGFKNVHGGCMEDGAHFIFNLRAGVAEGHDCSCGGVDSLDYPCSTPEGESRKVRLTLNQNTSDGALDDEHYIEEGGR